MLLSYIVILCIALLAGFVGPLVGGGGLVLLPVMLLMGIEPEVTIASIRCGAIGMWISALHSFYKRDLINWPVTLRLTFVALLGAFVGSELLILFIDTNLNSIVALILLGMIPLIYFKDKLFAITIQTSPLARILGYLSFFCVMVFASFFTGGDGTLGIIVLHCFFGLSLLEANAQRALPWLVMTVVASSRYAFEGIVRYDFAALLFLGMYIGVIYGIRMGVKKGDEWIRKLLLLVIAMLVGYLLVSKP